VNFIFAFLIFYSFCSYAETGEVGNNSKKESGTGVTMLEVIKRFQPDFYQEKSGSPLWRFSDLSKVSAKEFQTIGYVIMREGGDEVDSLKLTTADFNLSYRGSRDLLSSAEAEEFNSFLSSVLKNKKDGFDLS